MTCTVVLADDHPAFRSGIRSLLEKSGSHISVVGEASDGVEAIAAVRRLDPDVLLLDMEMPRMAGVEVAQAVKAEGLRARVLALSAYDDPTYVRGLLEKGAAGYITKDKAPSLIAEAVEAVARGEGRWFVTPSSEAGLASLTDRERDVLLALSEGRTNAAIAELLHLSEYTVRNHLTSVYSKLGLEGARDAVAWAWRTGVMSA
ncbi:MAG: response regulator transcription factor [Bacteroidota bacterium]